jgi:predicted DNA-binding ribbon-helix-helix protein
MRTTLDLEKPVLESLKRLQREEKATLGKIASRLIAEALRQREEQGKAARVELSWNVSDMGMKVDIADKEAVFRALYEA